MRPAKLLLSGLLGALITSPLCATEFDYDGDGIADVAVRRPDTQLWYVKNSGSMDYNSERGDGIQRVRFGLSVADIPVPADYDGDGITDFAVRRASNYTWYVLNSSGDNTNSVKEDGIQRQVFGRNSDDIPVPADYDGDGIADFAVRRSSNYTWYIKNSSGSNFNSEKEDGIQRIVFGKSPEDIPVKGDFDGDGIADVAVKRPSNGFWYILNSSGDNTNSERGDGIQRVSFSTAINDIPVPADYDGDGITDIAYRNPDNFTWYIRSSIDTTVTEIEFGLHPADIPVPADYNGDGKAELAIRRAGDQTFIIYNPDVVPGPQGRSAESDDDEQDSETVSFGSQSGDVPVNASTDQIMEKLDDTNANANGNSSNTLPTANAGDNQTVSTGALVTLDGTASSDDDGDSLTYTWTLRSSPDGSEAALSDRTAASPTFTADVDGNYVISLVVNDGSEDSAADRVRITAETTTANTAPMADAGSDQTVTVGTRVELDGSGSNDSDGDSLSYTWSFLSMPDGSEAQLGRTNIESPKFTADTAGTYVLQLIVNDGTEDSEADTVTITAESEDVNTAPTADAGTDQSATVGSQVTLDGSGSSDADGDALSYSWSFSSVPGDSDVSLSNADTATPSFTPRDAGDYVLTLTVSDGEDSDTDTVTVTASEGNSAPTAEAGSDQSVTAGDSVSLSGSGSSDADNDTLTYSWSFTSRPGGSTATLNNANNVNASFTADTEGDYLVQLTVSDGEDSDTDSVTISAEAATTSEPTDNESLLETTFDAARFDASADETIPARPYVMVDFVDYDSDGDNDAAILQSNGVPYTYDYDYSTSDANNIQNTCFDDPNNGPDEADSGGCYPIEASVRAFVVPTNPEVADSITNVSSDQHSGMAISGATFELPTAPSPEDNAGYAITNVYDEGWEVLDDCNGHSGYQGAPYHYHGDPTYPINDGTNEHTLAATEASDCLPDYELVVDEDTGHAPVIGYMADGFPIYGTDGYDIGDELDECNGHNGTTSEFPDGIYHYHALNYDAVTANGTGSRNEIPPLPECLSGKTWFVPEFHSPELSDSDKRDIDSEIDVESTNTTVDALTLATAFASNRFSATSTAEARPYVYVNFIDWDFDGENDTALLLSNGVPSTYDYDNTTSNSDDTANVCFDDPEGGPDTGCYSVDANNRVFLFSLNPTVVDAVTSISDEDHSGMAISGGTFAHPDEDSPNGEGYAVHNTYDSDWEVLDDCNGNVSYQGGPFHYHGDPTNPNRDQVDEHTASAARAEGCLPDFSSDVDETTSHGTVIGFMADGFPIYGEDGYDSGETLDACNGHTGATQEFPNGIYHYHAISADTASSENLAPLPTCLSGDVIYMPNYPAPELSATEN
ncbi:PKD domain-containing protein [Planctobacterium marinum]|uniref:PKD domain-containing protein n=1 Tax=Planctobacterium marinum TaxID=1631968 RepID=A0AA48KSR5_9ALTE|nr:hypothetical protein MACH26_29480 [Planctobacterium marinum]